MKWRRYRRRQGGCVGLGEQEGDDEKMAEVVETRNKPDYVPCLSVLPGAESTTHLAGGRTVGFTCLFRYTEVQESKGHAF